MKTLHVMTLDFIQKAAIRNFESATIERKWNGIDKLHLRLSADAVNAGELIEDRVIWFDREYTKGFIIEAVLKTLVNRTVMLNIEALHINSLLGDYITIPASGSATDEQTGTREQVVRAWVDNNVINPVDSSREQYTIVLGSYQGIGETITEATRYKPLVDEISTVLAVEDLGWNLEIDLENSQFVFNVLEGTDRTQTATPTNETVLSRDDTDAEWNLGTLSQVAAADDTLQLDEDPAATHDGAWLSWEGLTWAEVI